MKKILYILLLFLSIACNNKHKTETNELLGDKRIFIDKDNIFIIKDNKKYLIFDMIEKNTRKEEFCQSNLCYISYYGNTLYREKTNDSIYNFFVANLFLLDDYKMVYEFFISKEYGVVGVGVGSVDSFYGDSIAYVGIYHNGYSSEKLAYKSCFINKNYEYINNK